MNKSKKLFKAYALMDKEKPETFLTVTLTKNEALEYAVKYVLFVQFKDHFTQWCALRGLDTEDGQVWAEYLSLNTEELERYIVKEIFYTYAELVALVRMFAHSQPLGCTFEIPAEEHYWKYSHGEITEEVFDEVLKGLYEKEPVKE